MLEQIFKCLLIVFIVVVVWDISGFITYLSKALFKMAHPASVWMGQMMRRPFGCSYCMVFHSSWIYLILICGYNVIYGLAIACFMTFVGSAMRKLLKYITRLIN